MRARRLGCEVLKGDEHCLGLYHVEVEGGKERFLSGRLLALGCGPCKVTPELAETGHLKIIENLSRTPFGIMFSKPKFKAFVQPTHEPMERPSGSCCVRYEPRYRPPR